MDKPVIFNFHGYPWLIHRLAYRRTNHKNMHVRGYKEKGNINTPLELAIQNQIDRFSLAIDVIDRVPELQVTGAHAKEKFRNHADRLPELLARTRHGQARGRSMDLAWLKQSGTSLRGVNSESGGLTGDDSSRCCLFAPMRGDCRWAEHAIDPDGLATE